MRFQCCDQRLISFEKWKFEFTMVLNSASTGLIEQKVICKTATWSMDISEKTTSPSFSTRGRTTCSWKYTFNLKWEKQLQSWLESCFHSWFYLCCFSCIIILWLNNKIQCLCLWEIERKICIAVLNQRVLAKGLKKVSRHISAIMGNFPCGCS